MTKFSFGILVIAFIIIVAVITAPIEIKTYDGKYKPGDVVYDNMDGERMILKSLVHDDNWRVRHKNRNNDSCYILLYEYEFSKDPVTITKTHPIIIKD